MEETSELKRHQEHLEAARKEAGEGTARADAGVDIGARLHALRKARNLTLTQVSTMSGVSASAFSKIERNELSPTLGTLQRIAQGFGVDLTTLLGNNGDSPSAPGRRAISRAGSGSRHLTSTCVNTLLCADLRHKRMTPIVTTVNARAIEEYKSWPKSDAEIFVYVLEGTLVVHSTLYEPVELNKGDSIYYDANTEHAWTSKGDEPARVLWVIVAP